jgi:hypothetical protein
MYCINWKSMFQKTVCCGNCCSKDNQIVKCRTSSYSVVSCLFNLFRAALDIPKLKGKNGFTCHCQSS